MKPNVKLNGRTINVNSHTEERKSFVFYLSFEKAIQELDDFNQLSLYRAIVRYSFWGEIPQISGTAAVVWDLIKPTLDKCRIKSLNGKKALGISKPSLVGNQNAKKATVRKLSITIGIESKDK